MGTIRELFLLLYWPYLRVLKVYSGCAQESILNLGDSTWCQGSKRDQEHDKNK